MVKFPCHRPFLRNGMRNDTQFDCRGYPFEGSVLPSALVHSARSGFALKPDDLRRESTIPLSPSRRKYLVTVHFFPSLVPSLRVRRGDVVDPYVCFWPLREEDEFLAAYGLGRGLV